MSENQKKIWITGASSGIGKAVAEKLRMSQLCIKPVVHDFTHTLILDLKKILIILVS